MFLNYKIITNHIESWRRYTENSVGITWLLLVFLFFQLIVLQLIHNTVVNLSCVHFHFASLSLTKGLRGLGLYKRFCPVVVPFTVYTLFDILGTEKKGPKCSSTRYLCTCTFVQPFINQRTLGSMQSERGSCFVRLSDVYDTFAAGKGGYGQTGLFWIISDFSKATIALGAEAAYRRILAVLNLGPVLAPTLSSV